MWLQTDQTPNMLSFRSIILRRIKVVSLVFKHIKQNYSWSVRLLVLQLNTTLRFCFVRHFKERDLLDVPDLHEVFLSSTSWKFYAVHLTSLNPQGELQCIDFLFKQSESNVTVMLEWFTLVVGLVHKQYKFKWDKSFLYNHNWTVRFWQSRICQAMILIDPGFLPTNWLKFAEEQNNTSINLFQFNSILFTWLPITTNILIRDFTKETSSI